jgi:hypothetical protein
MICVHSEEEVTIMDEQRKILCKFNKCIGGFLIQYDKKRVKDFTMDEFKIDAQNPMSFYSYETK